MEAWPSVIINAPNTIAFRWPKKRSAISPPKIGVMYTNPVYQP